MVSAVTVFNIIENLGTNEAPLKMIDILIPGVSTTASIYQHMLNAITGRRIRIISCRTDTGTAIAAEVNTTTAGGTATILFKGKHGVDDAPGGWGAHTAVIALVYTETPEHDCDG